MTNKETNNKKRNLIIVGILLLLLFCVTLGSAYLTQMLQINGTTSIAKSSWDIHFANEAEQEGSVTAREPLKIDTSKTLITFSITFTKPGDFYEFEVDTVNDGAMDAMVDRVTKVGISEENAKYISFETTYSDGAPIKQYDLLAQKTSERIKVRVEFKEVNSAEELPPSDLDLNLELQIEYIQSDENAHEREEVKKDNGSFLTYITNLETTDKINLAYDETVDNNLRYIGLTPNNYVNFNGELWRIIGVMNNIEDSDGNKASHIKLIRNQSIGVYSWDNKPAGTGSSTSSDGSNDWSDSRLMMTLNSGPYWTRINGTCPYGQNDQTKSCDFSSIGLTEDAKAMISKVVWNLGKVVYSADKASIFYAEERGTTGFEGRPTTWTGNVGLMYASDYGYAVGGSYRSNCLKTSLGSYDTGGCSANDWLRPESSEWTLTASSYNDITTYYIHRNRFLHTTQARDVLSFRPVVYLKTNIQFVIGEGSYSNPYIIKLP